MKRNQLFFFVLFLFAQVSLYSQTVQYTYDKSGNRVRRTNSNGDGGGLTETVSVTESGAVIKLYPNPTHGRFTVAIANIPSGEKCELFLYDTQGRLLEKKTVNSESKTDFDISRQAGGTYFLKVRTGKKENTFKIIKT